MNIYRESRHSSFAQFLMQLMKRVTQTGSNVTSMLHNATVTSHTGDIIPMEAEFDQRPLDLKLVFLGDSAVGKTALLRRFSTGLPPEEGQPVDAYTFTDSIQVDGKKYFASCWEVGLWSEGCERLRPLSYPGTDIFLLCFDITNQASFNSIKDSWISEIRHHMPYIYSFPDSWQQNGPQKEEVRVLEVEEGEGGLGSCTQTVRILLEKFFCTENIFNGYLMPMPYCPALLIAKLS